MVEDRYGIAMQFKSATLDTIGVGSIANNIQSWYFNGLDDSRLVITPNNTTTVDPVDKNKIISGGGNIISGGNIETLFEILTTSGYDPTKILMDHKAAKAQRSMMSSSDWTNFEVTFYITINGSNPNSELSIYGRSGRHLIGRPCEGTYYQLSVTMDGYVRCEMKHYHPGGYELLDEQAMFGDLEGMKFGLKFIVYNNNTRPDNTTAVFIRSYTDMNNENKWVGACSYDDVGDRGNKYMYCGDETTKLITWGGPIIGLKLVNFPENAVVIENFSVREIDALTPKVTLPAAKAIVPEYSVPNVPPSDFLRPNDPDDWDDDTTYPPPDYA